MTRNIFITFIALFNDTELLEKFSFSILVSNYWIKTKIEIRCKVLVKSEKIVQKKPR